MSGRFFFAAWDQALWQPRVSDTESQIPIREFSPPPLLPPHMHNLPTPGWIQLLPWAQLFHPDAEPEWAAPPSATLFAVGGSPSLQVACDPEHRDPAGTWGACLWLLYPLFYFLNHLKTLHDLFQLLLIFIAPVLCDDSRKLESKAGQERTKDYLQSCHPEITAITILIYLTFRYIVYK